jgi:DnaJ-class molecular chaperone with C-terminal Zn finger domain
MILKLLLVIAVLLLLFGGLRKYKKLPPERQRALLIKIAVFGLAGILLVGVATGRMHWFGAVIAALLPILKFGLHTVMRVMPLWLQRTGGVASFKTEHLDVTIVIRTGQLNGSVIKGPCAGKAIGELTEDDLQELENYYRDCDMKSYYLIRFARKGQTFGANQQPPPPPPSFGNPGRDEALQILGLSDNPSREEIIAAHRRLINKLHPDRGGSDFLAARVNQARDILLKE